jgi:hypothetical protein
MRGVRDMENAIAFRNKFNYLSDYDTDVLQNRGTVLQLGVIEKYSLQGCPHEFENSVVLLSSGFFDSEKYKVLRLLKWLDQHDNEYKNFFISHNEESQYEEISQLGRMIKDIQLEVKADTLRKVTSDESGYVAPIINVTFDSLGTAATTRSVEFTYGQNKEQNFIKKIARLWAAKRKSVVPKTQAGKFYSTRGVKNTEVKELSLAGMGDNKIWF